MKNLLHWLPYIILTVYALMLSAFALDAWSGPETIFHKAGHFLLHLIPAFLVLFSIALASKYPTAAGLFLMILGMVFTIYFGTHHDNTRFATISMPLFVSGVLFMFHKYFQ